MSATTTFDPASAKARTTAWPITVAAPVTIAVLPSRPLMGARILRLFAER
jgi:hypothetical protein